LSNETKTRRLSSNEARGHKGKPIEGQRPLIQELAQKKGKGSIKLANSDYTS